MESSTEDPNAEWIQNITTTTMSTTLATSTIIPVPETTFYDGSGSGGNFFDIQVFINDFSNYQIQQIPKSHQKEK